MAVRVSYASISEKGTINGAVGDSTGKEVLTGNWYNMAGCDFMAIYPDESIRAKAAKQAKAGADNDCIGYGQSARNTLYAAVKSVKDLAKVTTKCNTDCSEFQNCVWYCVGVATHASNGWTTSTMRSALKSLGFKIVTTSKYLHDSKYAVEGAIYVSEGEHTYMSIDNGSAYKETLEAAGLSASGSTSSSKTSNQPSKSDYKVGTIYKVKINGLKVRKGAGTNYAQKKKSELTSDGQAHSDSSGRLKKGTEVRCLAVKSISSTNTPLWIEIPSGWVCVYYKPDDELYVG